MIMTEFNIDIAKEVWQEEAREDAREEGRAEGRTEEKAHILSLLESGHSLDEIKMVLKTPVGN